MDISLPLFQLTDRVALVTGGSRGIGEAIARLLASAGAHVIVASRKIEGCEIVAESIRSAGGSAEARSCHIGEMAAIEALWADIASTHGRCDVLVNNAATNPYFGPVERTEPRAFDKTIEVNVRGYFYMTTHAVKLMKSQERRGAQRGSVINIASINGVVPGHWQGIYSISKAAILSMTQSFAKELAPQGIRVNAILPGLTETKFASALTQNASVLKTVMPHIPMGRVADPSELAGAALYLASDASSYVTGSHLAVDGGYLTA